MTQILARLDAHARFATAAPHATRGVLDWFRARATAGDLPRESWAEFGAPGLAPDDQTNQPSEYDPGCVTGAVWRVAREWVEEATGARVEPENSFARINRSGAVLRAHLDRQVLDWTLSWMVAAYPDTLVWPIHTRVGRIDMKVGSGVILPGNVLPHWRRSLAAEWAGVLMLHFRVASRGLNGVVEGLA